MQISGKIFEIEIDPIDVIEKLYRGAKEHSRLVHIKDEKYYKEEENHTSHSFFYDVEIAKKEYEEIIKHQEYIEALELVLKTLKKEK